MAEATAPPVVVAPASAAAAGGAGGGAAAVPAASAAAASKASAGSVISVHADVVEAFKQLKTRRASRFLIFSLTDAYLLVLSKKGPVAATAMDFIKALPTSDCRYAVFDHEFTTKSGMKSSKLIFITHTPESATGRSKMFYSSQRRGLDEIFTGVEDAQVSKVPELATLLGVKSLIPDEEDTWDPDA